MRSYSPIYDGIMCVIDRNGVREDLSRYFVPVVNSIYSPFHEGLTNEGHVPHDVIEKHEFTVEANRVWLDLGFILLWFGK